MARVEPCGVGVWRVRVCSRRRCYGEQIRVRDYSRYPRGNRCDVARSEGIGDAGLGAYLMVLAILLLIGSGGIAVCAALAYLLDGVAMVLFRESDAGGPLVKPDARA